MKRVHAKDKPDNKSAADLGYAGLLWKVVSRGIDTEPGKSFGEFALISDDNVRNASIIADEPTNLMSVSRSIFNRSLKARQIEDYEERKAFITGSPFFKSWPTKFQRLLEMSIRKEKYSFESVIVRQGEPVLGLHFIISGNAKLTIEPSSHQQQFTSIMNRIETQTEADKIRKNRSNVTRRVNSATTHRHLQQTCVHIRRKHGYAAAEKQRANKTLELCTIGENEVFGDVEVLLQLDQYLQTVTCTSNTEVFVLDLKNYDRLVKRFYSTLDLFKDKAREKLRCRTQTVYGRQVPILNHLLGLLNELPNRDVPREVEDKETAKKDIQDTNLKNLVKLYLNDKITALVEPCVPGTLFYRTMSFKKEQARIAAMEKLVPGSGHKGWRFFYHVNDKTRRPRSRRELESLAQNSSGGYGKTKQIFLSERRPSYACSLPTDDTVVEDMLEELNAVVKQKEDEYRRKSLGIEDIDSNLTRESLIEVIDEMENCQQKTTATRSKIVSNLMEKDDERNKDLFRLTRPRSAPQGLRARLGSVSSCGSDDIDIDEYFDKETSDTALVELESKVKMFLEQYTDGKSNKVPSVREMKRFELKSVADVPIAGGTVLVRQRECRYPRGSVIHEDSHRHIRHFMLPKNAIASVADERERIRRIHSAKSSRSVPANTASSTSKIVRPKSAFAG